MEVSECLVACKRLCRVFPGFSEVQAEALCECILHEDADVVRRAINHVIRTHKYPSLVPAVVIEAIRSEHSRNFRGMQFNGRGMRVLPEPEPTHILDSIDTNRTRLHETMKAIGMEPAKIQQGDDARVMLSQILGAIAVPMPDLGNMDHIRDADEAAVEHRRAMKERAEEEVW